MVSNRLKTKRMSISYLFSRIAMRSLLKDDRSMPRHATSAREFVVVGAGDKIYIKLTHP